MKIGKDKTLKQHWNDVKDSFEKGFYKVFPWFQIVTTLIFIALFGVFLMGLFTKVDIETEGWCNSGKIGLDIEVENIIQNRTCMERFYNETTQDFESRPDSELEGVTCFKENYILEHIKLKDIDGLNCQGSAKVKMPMIMSLLMGDEY